jgi:hypothetical protein
MIVHESSYLRWIQQQGVGNNDRVASSPRSYVSYLNSVSELIGSDMSPAVLHTEENVLGIARRLEGKRADATVRNYKSAMRQYVAMVEAGFVRAK